ncbi:MAG: carbon storage regulator [Pseudomonadota bacterium]|nr:carbon storage regulator [Pseudomonadota bacterium]
MKHAAQWIAGMAIALMAVTAQAADQEIAFAHPMGDEELAQYRGAGLAMNYNLSSLNAALNNTSAVNTVSGGNVLQSGALTQVSGITSVIQNSGNNVIIQSNTIVNLTMN